MTILSCLAANWQKALPYLSALGLAAWIALFRNHPLSERALFAALLVIYMLHQIEEHLWPGGFRQFANAHVFKSGDDNWPVGIGGVALVNIGLCLAADRPRHRSILRHCAGLALAWIGLTLINALTHIVSTIWLRVYNPGLVTSIVLFLPFTIFALALEARAWRAVRRRDRLDPARRNCPAPAGGGVVRRPVRAPARRRVVSMRGPA